MPPNSLGGSSSKKWDAAVRPTVLHGLGTAVSSETKSSDVSSLIRLTLAMPGAVGILIPGL